MAKATERRTERRGGEGPEAGPARVPLLRRRRPIASPITRCITSLRSSGRTSSILRASLREFGLSVPMWRALAALHQKDGQTIGEIAQLAVLDRSSLGRLLDEMAKDGLVEREPLPDDRRALSIKLSAKGREKFEASLPLAQLHYRNVLKGVSPEEFETLMRVLRRIKANTRMMSDVADLETEMTPG